MGSVNLHAGKARFLCCGRGNGKALDQVFNLAVRQRNRYAKLPTGQPQGHSRRGLGRFIDNGLRLPTGMADLHPQMIASDSSRLRPGGECRLHFSRGWTINNDVARPLQMVPVNDDVARQVHARPAFRPAAIEPIQSRGWHTIGGRQPFGHRPLCQSVGQSGTTGQAERLGNPHAADASSQTARYFLRSETLSIFSVPRRGRLLGSNQILAGILKAAIRSFKKAISPASSNVCPGWQ